ncbi:HU family DNA-binding protein [Massilibacteroides sp.]|uniref:HU family DNA-binding protein n=1 Tax=Massilibacteroides sp. TaxID=2034766 RepID=UPI002610D11D|nr:HU family DNA-binding protein [Massilibacteroides sp.]MDD4515983.1 HU family DNA-binding protein [Massilibacteroides sp.]
MGQNFKLVHLYSKPGDKNSEKKWYAASKSNGIADLDELCMLIAARSTVSSADVKAVLDNLNFVIDFQLKAGRIVQLGELGNFRMSVGSEGVTEKKDFSTSMLKTPKIVFTPGASLRETRITTKFNQISDGQTPETGNNNGNGGDDEGGEI